MSTSTAFKSVIVNCNARQNSNYHGFIFNLSRISKKPHAPGIRNLRASEYARLTINGLS